VALQVVDNEHLCTNKPNSHGAPFVLVVVCTSQVFRRSDRLLKQTIGVQRYGTHSMEIGDGVTKTVERPALSDAVRPGVGDRVTVSYIGKLPSGQVFDTSRRGGPEETVSFELGSPYVVAGLNVAVSSMAVGEQASFDLPPNAAFGEEGLPAAGVPPNSRVVFDVTLVAVNRSPSDPPSSRQQQPGLPSDYNPLLDADTLKGHGNDRLRATDFTGALYKYRQVIRRHLLRFDSAFCF
jgi:hypothetical protein